MCQPPRLSKGDYLRGRLLNLRLFSSIPELTVYKEAGKHALSSHCPATSFAYLSPQCRLALLENLSTYVSLR